MARRRKTKRPGASRPRRRSRSSVRQKGDTLAGSKKKIAEGMPDALALAKTNDDLDANFYYCRLKQVHKWTNGAIAVILNENLDAGQLELDASEVREIFGPCARVKKGDLRMKPVRSRR